MGQLEERFLYVGVDNIAKDQTRTDLASVKEIQEEWSSLAALCNAVTPSLVLFARQEYFFNCRKKRKSRAMGKL